MDDTRKYKFVKSEAWKQIPHDLTRETVKPNEEHTEAGSEMVTIGVLSIQNDIGVLWGCKEG